MSTCRWELRRRPCPPPDSRGIALELCRILLLLDLLGLLRTAWEGRDAAVSDVLCGSGRSTDRQRAAPRFAGDPADRVVCHFVRCGDLCRHGAVRGGQGTVSPSLHALAVRDPQPVDRCTINPSRACSACSIPRRCGLLRALRGILRGADRRGGGDRRQVRPTLVRPPRGQPSAPPGQRPSGAVGAGCCAVGSAAADGPASSGWSWANAELTGTATRSPPCPSSWPCSRSRAARSPPMRCTAKRRPRRRSSTVAAITSRP